MILQCKAIAAAVLGDPKKVVLLDQSTSERFDSLQNRSIDLQMRVVPTMERRVHEVRNRGSLFLPMLIQKRGQY